MTLSESYLPADRSAEIVDTTIGELLAEAATEAPNTVAVVEVDANGRRREVTYAELLDAVTRTAHELSESYEPGQRVAIWAPSTLNWEVFQFGAAMAGLVLVTVNPGYRASELRYVLRQSRCAGIALAAEYRGESLPDVLASVRSDLPELRNVHDLDDWNPPAHRWAGELPRVEPDAAAMIQYTSGTTGRPKGALLSHRGLVNNARLFARRFGIEHGTIWLDPLPMFHLSGCGFAAMGAMWVRSTHVMFRFEPGLAVRLVESERATFLPAVPTMLLAMLEHPDFDSVDLSSLELVMSGGTTVAPEVVRLVESRLGARFGVVFGQTEVSGVICQSFPDDTSEDKANRVGRPLEHTEIRVVDAEEDVVPCGVTGQIQVRGFGVMLGYFDAPEASAQAITEDGWLRTGDLGVMDNRGYMQVTGRLKDMIIRGGENIYPREIEDLLLRHAQVGDVAVVGVPDDRWGEKVAAFVRPAGPEPLRVNDLIGYLRTELASSKLPSVWVSVPQLPTTPSGKIQKFVLRDEYCAGKYVALE